MITLTANLEGIQKQWPFEDKLCADPALLKSANGRLIKFSSDEMKKLAIEKVKPKYPSSCRCLGKVTAECVVDLNGKVICVRVVSGHPLLRGAIVEAARLWRFATFKKDGKPVAVYGQLDFHFTSDGEVAY
jgi:outer membrane biosynthesis protein TonB